MKLKLLHFSAVLFTGLLLQSSNALALKICIADEFGDLYSMQVHNYNGPGNIKTVTGQVDLLTGNLWDLTGTLNKSTKTFYLVSTNPLTDFCVTVSGIVYDTLIFTGDYTSFTDDWSNDCGAFGSLIVTGERGECTFPAQRLAGQSSSAKVQHNNSVKRIVMEAFPNPASNNVTINYSLTEESDVQISVYNELGQLEKVLLNQKGTPGTYTTNWDATNSNQLQVSKGLYFIRIITKSGIKSIPLVIE